MKHRKMKTKIAYTLHPYKIELAERGNYFSDRNIVKYVKYVAKSNVCLYNRFCLFT